MEIGLLQYLAQQRTDQEATIQQPSGGEESGPAQESSSLFGGDYFIWIMIAGMGLFMYFFVIRPQRKEESRKKEMLSKLKKGDGVITSSGILGTVHSVKDETVMINVGDNTRLEVLRSHIGSVRNPGDKLDKEKTGSSK